jgi:hypothetical protein
MWPGMFQAKELDTATENITNVATRMTHNSFWS